MGTVGLLVTLLVVMASAEQRAQAAEATASTATAQNAIADSPFLLAQAITPGRDRTNTRVRARGNRIDIDGGSRSRDGANLFHSFERFGLSRNQIANFLTDPQIRNILGRVTGGEVSRINGLIRVTGGNANLFLLNPAGIIFGTGARLDVAGDFTATTADRIGFGDRWLNALGNADYANLLGNPSAFALTSAQPGAILNEGNLAVAAGQTLNLLGGTVVNTGTLTAPGGQITVTAVPGTNRVEIRQEGTLLVLEVQPLGSDDLANPLPFTPESLPMVLTGGSDNPATGVTVNPDGTVQLTASNTVIPTTPGTAIVAGTVDVSSPGSALNQTGGTAGVFGTQVGLVGANVNASGTQGGGTVLIGGDYLGQGTVPNAQSTTVSADSTLSADATVSGNGGRVIVWADDTTRFLGNITARGGATGGNGGFVETSGARSLDTSSAQVEASAPNGTPGTWLLDPSDITIQTGGTGTLAAGLFDPPTTGAASIIDPLIIATALDGGTSVIITTSSGTGGVGDIRLDSPINQIGGGTASLTLTGSDSFSFAMGSTINLTSTGGLTFNVNQVDPRSIVNGLVIQDAVDAIGTVAGSSTINLGAGTYQLPVDLTINKSLTINGAGAATTILDGQSDVIRVLDLSGAGVTLNLNGLSLDNGLVGGISVSGATLNLNNSNVRDNSFAGNFSSNGAGILNDSTGTVNVTNSTIGGNFATGGFGGGIFNQGVLRVTNSTISGNSAINGGGIYNDSLGTVTVIGSTVSGNSAASPTVLAFGGGIYNQSALTITNSTLSGNTAANDGGGILNNSDGLLTITDSTLNNNSASSGGGFSNRNGAIATISNSVITGNRATSVGGGGIFNPLGSQITIANSTIANNTAIGNGGGIDNRSVATITDSTIRDNTTAASGGGIFSSTNTNLALANTTLLGNTAAGAANSIDGLLLINSPVTVGAANLSVSANVLQNTGDFRLTSPGALNFSVDSELVTQGGDVSLEAADSVFVNGAIATSGGAVRLIGDTDDNGQGRVEINQAIDTSGGTSGGAISIQGSSVNNPGILINDFSLISGGALITLTGISTSDKGIEITGFGSIDSGGGDVSLTGTSTTGQGISLTGADGSTRTAISSGGGNVNLTGGDRLFLGSPISLGGLEAPGTLTLTADAMDFGSGFSIDSSGDLLLQPTGDTLTLLSALDVGGGSFLNDAVVNVTLQAEQDITTRSISTSRGRGGNLQITSTNGDLTTGRLSTSALFSNSAAIALSAVNGSISTGDLNTSWSDSGTGSGNGGSVSLIARDRITTGNINTSSANGNGGDVTLDPRGDVEVGLINAEGNGGTGGNVDITTGRFFRALQSFTAQNGAIASISTVGTAGNGTITIRHGGGQRDVPFRVGNAETNGTAAALTTGAFTLENRDIPGSFNQGGIRLITRNQPDQPDTPTTEDDPTTRDLIKPGPQQSDPESPDELIPDDVTIDARNNSFEVVADLEEDSAAQFESYLDIPVQEQAPILTSADVGEALDQIKTATGVTPCLIYLNFFPSAESATLAQAGGSTPESENDLLELVMVTGDQQVIRKAVRGATRGLVLAIARQFRSAIIDPSDRQSTAAMMASSQQLYQWLIAPLEAEIQQRGIQNLSFVPDVGLRSLPMAALHDGNQFLVEKYSIGLMPAISLVDTRYVSLRDTQVLAMGASQFPQFPDLSALPGVPLELSTIPQNQWLGLFLPSSADFTVNTLQSQRQEIPYGIVHLATHANFQPGQPSNSYIQFEDQRLRLDQLRELGWNDPPIELLILSACRTALGNEQAELGFAGAALQARVKSVLASLWSVNDLGSSGLMAEFYDQLRTAPIKAEALRAAQLAMLRGEVYVKDGRLHWSGGDIPLPPDLVGLPDTSFAHPYYWSAFTLIGSPW